MWMKDIHPLITQGISRFSMVFSPKDMD